MTYGGTSDVALSLSDAQTGWTECRPTNANEIKACILCDGSQVLEGDKHPFNPYEVNHRTLLTYSDV